MFTASVPIYHTGNRAKIKHVSVILTFSCSAGFEDFAQKKTDRTWLCVSVTLAPKVVEGCSKAQKTQQVF